MFCTASSYFSTHDQTTHTLRISSVIMKCCLHIFEGRNLEKLAVTDPSESSKKCDVKTKNPKITQIRYYYQSSAQMDSVNFDSKINSANSSVWNKCGVDLYTVDLINVST